MCWCVNLELWDVCVCVGGCVWVCVWCVGGYVCVCVVWVCVYVVCVWRGEERGGWDVKHNFMAVPCASFSETSRLTVTLLLLVAERVYVA